MVTLFHWFQASHTTTLHNMHKKFYEGRTRHFFNTTIGTAKTKCVSLPRLKPNGWIKIIQSILQVGVNSVESAEFTRPVEYPQSDK